MQEIVKKQALVNEMTSKIQTNISNKNHAKRLRKTWSL